jgi:hypothetical protein
MLGDKDRDALLLRFAQDQSLRQVGEQLGLSEEAAKKRVARAIDRLRCFFASRGITLYRFATEGKSCCGDWTGIRCCEGCPGLRNIFATSSCVAGAIDPWPNGWSTQHFRT